MSRATGTTEKASEPNWTEEWLPLNAITQHGPLQVRKRLNEAAVRRYRDMTNAGSEPPPILVGRNKGMLYLVDGWHRMEAGALVHLRDHDGLTVKAMVADLTEAEIRWEAAKANLGHGVPLKFSEYRGVLKAFIKAGKNKRPDGSLMSYRELGATVGKGHTTVRNWVQKDFPKLAAKMGGSEGGNVDAGPPPVERRTFADELRDEAVAAVVKVRADLRGMTPTARWELVRELEAARNAALALGVSEPESEPF